jgi:hypothetical protein
MAEGGGPANARTNMVTNGISATGMTRVEGPLAKQPSTHDLNTVGARSGLKRQLIRRLGSAETLTIESRPIKAAHASLSSSEHIAGAVDPMRAGR